MKYKVEDVVKVLDTPQIRSWHNGEKAIGQIFKIKYDEISSKENVYTLGNNKYMINYADEDLELLCRKDRVCKKCKNRLLCLTS